MNPNWAHDFILASIFYRQTTISTKALLILSLASRRKKKNEPTASLFVPIRLAPADLETKPRTRTSDGGLMTPSSYLRLGNCDARMIPVWYRFDTMQHTIHDQPLVCYCVGVRQNVWIVHCKVLFSLRYLVQCTVASNLSSTLCGKIKGANLLSWACDIVLATLV